MATRLAGIAAALLIVMVPAAAFAQAYAVASGDSLWKIGQEHGTTVDAIMSRNGLVSTTIHPGQVLDVPESTGAGDKTGIGVAGNELDLLARMIAAEAGDEPYQGKVAVGAVIVNRAKSSKFPNTLTAVMYQPGQFEPVQNGWLWRATVTQEDRAAAQAAIRGEDPTNGALYFFAFKKVRSGWLWSRPWKITIGNHRFTV
jgi:N-acetylmuramoyl-L-alanine amidase